MMFMSKREWTTMKFNHYVQRNCIKLSGHSFQNSFESGVNNHKKAVTGLRNNPRTLNSYCWFPVSRHSKQIKIKIKIVQQIKSRIWEMKGGTYTKTLGKIQVRGIFRVRDIRRNVLLMEICMETPCWCSPRWAPTWRTETNRNICYRVQLQKREFILRQTHKH